MREEEMALKVACENAKKTGSIQEEELQSLRNMFGERFDKALKLVNERRVKRYTFEPSGRVVWIIVGKEREYQILPKAKYCSCDDFYFRVIDGEAGLCYHLIAQCIAEALGSLEEVRDSDEFYEPLMDEWRSQARQSGIARP